MRSSRACSQSRKEHIMRLTYEERRLIDLIRETEARRGSYWRQRTGGVAYDWEARLALLLDVLYCARPWRRRALEDAA
jgi:hypothetical protein